MDPEIEKHLFQTTYASLRKDIISSIYILSFFLLFSLFVKFILKLSVSFYLILILLLWVFTYVLHYFVFVKKQKTFKDLYKFQFIEGLIDLLFVSFVIHFLGSTEWISPLIYLIILLGAVSILPLRQNLILTLFCVMFYIILITLEYFQILPHYSLFNFPLETFKNPKFLIVHIITVITFYFFVIFNYGDISEKLRKKHLENLLVQKELEEAKSVLEIKVKARTKELQELADSLEEQVKARTKELQEKIEELERFQRLVIGRELKMIELKEELKKLKEKLENQTGK